MTLDIYIRFAGTVLMIGGISATLGWLLFAIYDPNHERTTSRLWIFSNLLIIFGGLFIAMGLPGFYLAQGEHAGVVGLAGFVIIFIGITIPYVAVHSIETTTSPNTPARMKWFVSVGAPSALIGAILVGIVSYMSGIYPKWLAIALIAAVLLGLIPQMRKVPGRYSRGVFPAIFTVVIVIFGFYTAFRL